MPRTAKSSDLERAAALSRERERSPASGPDLSFNPKDCIFGELNRENAEDFLKVVGEFMVRRGSDGGMVLSVRTSSQVKHFNLGTRPPYKIEGAKVQFNTVEETILYYYTRQKSISRDSQAMLLKPCLNTYQFIEYSRIKFCDRLGAGNFGEVYRATLLPGQGDTQEMKVAVKILSANSDAKVRAECLAEAKLMSMLQHRNIVQMKGVCLYHRDAMSASNMMIVLEFCNGGSLDKIVKANNLTGKGKVKAMLDAACGMEYLHSRGVIHRDVASRNCLVQRYNNGFTTKIADFGLSRLAPDHYDIVNKKRHMPIFATAPETLKFLSWTAESDVWSFGILLLEVYNGAVNPYETHFYQSKLADIMKKLLDGFRLDAPSGMPREMATIAGVCMREATQRPPMSDVYQRIRSYYVSMDLI